MRTLPAKIGVLVAFVIVTLTLLSWIQRRIAPESTPVARGAEQVTASGCIECHGQPENPQVDDYRNCSLPISARRHPNYGFECADVMAYFESVRLKRDFEDRARLGRDNSLIVGEKLARTYHCFQCHGQMGQGGFSNSGAFKGYVPGYFGDDFRTLTRNGDPNSVRDWIVHGVDPEVVDHPLTGWIVKFYFKKQAVGMPSYKSLPADEIETLVDYVIALNEFGPMTAQTLRLYGERSNSTESIASSERGGQSTLMQSAIERR